jgi:hypothetical protein
MTSLAEYNNNPGNIRPPKGLTYTGQLGIDDKGFAIFATPDDGRKALAQDIGAKQKQGLNTPDSFINKYTPASPENSEESRDNYKIGLAQHLGLKSTADPFPDGSEQKIADYIASFESGKKSAFDQGETEADKMAKEKEKLKKPMPVAQKPLDEILSEGLGYVLGKAQDNSDVLAAGAAGAAKGAAEKFMLDPSANVMKAGETTREQVLAATRKASDLYNKMEGLAEEVRLRQENNLPIDDLRKEANRLRVASDRAADELRTAKEQVKTLSRPPVVEAAADAAETVASRKKAGASGASNWVRSMADEVPDVLANKAENMRKNNPKGGQAIIDADTIQREKIRNMGNPPLRTLESGVQLHLPDAVASDLDKELAEKQAKLAEQQAQRAAQAETQKLAQEDLLKRQQASAAAQESMARQRKIDTGRAASEAAKRVNQEQQQAAREADQMSKARVASDAATTAARETQAAKPGTLTMMAREAGRRVAEKAPIIGGTLSAAGATLSAKEAVDRYSKGDYSGMVLGTIEALLNVASMTPPVTPMGMAAKGIGTAGSFGMIPVWIAHDYFSNKGPWAKDKKAQGGLSLAQ